MLKYAIPALALVFVGACGDDDKGDTADSAVGDDDDDTTDTDTPAPTDTLLATITVPGCGADAASDEWVYSAETDGWTDGANIVNAWETNTGGTQMWSEEHDLPSVDYDPNGTWDYLELILMDEAQGTFQENVSTLFVCGTHDTGGSNTYAFRVFDINGNYADCAIVDDDGPDNDGAAEVFDDPEAGINPVSAPEQINSIDCIIW